MFDLDKIHGGLEVRWGRAGERSNCSTARPSSSTTDVGVIADASGQVESLAGIMGGNSTAVSLDTTSIYVEAAFWWPEAIAGRARRYNFSTDAAQRFERGVDPRRPRSITSSTLSRLILRSAAARRARSTTRSPGCRSASAGDAAHRARAQGHRRRPVRGRDRRRVHAPAVCRSSATGDDFVVTPPSYRFDLQIEEDLIEEVARIWGYERLPVRPPRRRVADALAARSPAQRARRQARDRRARLPGGDQLQLRRPRGSTALLGNGAPIRLLNPIAAQMDVMRTTLWGGLVETLRANLNRKASRVRLFEVGRVFGADASVQSGPLTVRGVSASRRCWPAWPTARRPKSSGACRPRAVDFFDLKGDLEALFGCRASCVSSATSIRRCIRGAALGMAVDGSAVGWIGALHPALQQELELPQAPVLFEIELDALIAQAGAGVQRRVEVSAGDPRPRAGASVSDSGRRKCSRKSHAAVR